MLLINADDVRAVYPTDRDDAAMAPFLAAAGALYDERLGGKGLSSAIAKEVQRYFAGHLLFVADAGLHESIRVEDVSETFTKNRKQPGLMDSRWGAMAIAFDSTGTLAGMASLRPLAMLKLVGVDAEGASVGANTYSIIDGATVGTVLGGTTLYIGNVEDLDFNDVSVPTPGSQLVQLLVDATAVAGDGQSFTYEVYRKARAAAAADPPVATGFGVTIGGATELASLVNGAFTFDEQDRFAVRLVTSAGAATAKHKYTAKFKLPA